MTAVISAAETRALAHPADEEHSRVGQKLLSLFCSFVFPLSALLSQVVSAHCLPIYAQHSKRYMRLGLLPGTDDGSFAACYTGRLYDRAAGDRGCERAPFAFHDVVELIGDLVHDIPYLCPAVCFGKAQLCASFYRCKVSASKHASRQPEEYEVADARRFRISPSANKTRQGHDSPFFPLESSHLLQSTGLRHTTQSLLRLP